VYNVSIVVVCTSCGTKLAAPDNSEGKTAKCQNCGTSFQIRRPDEVVGAGLDQLRSPQPPPIPPAFYPQSASRPNQSTPTTKRCPFCAEQIAADAIKCKHCGTILVSIPGVESQSGGRAGRVYASDPPKDPLLMAFLSGCCIFGLGQIVLGQTIKGVMILVGALIFVAGTFGHGILVIWVLWPLAALDAYMIAKKLRAGKSVGDWECF
jgi:TM2 domain-containing membrane protein YozV